MMAQAFLGAPLLYCETPLFAWKTVFLSSSQLCIQQLNQSYGASLFVLCSRCQVLN